MKSLAAAFLLTTHAWQQTEFAIVAYSDPPLDEHADASYAAMARAGFNVVIGGFAANTTSTIEQQLSLCTKYEMQAIAGGYNTFSSSNLPPCSAGCYGVFVRDEPSAADFSSLASSLQAVVTKYPNRFGYVNLFPNDCPSCWGVPTYEQYVEQFILTVKPSVLSFDRYPSFRVGRPDKLSYEANCATFRFFSLKYNLPWWNFFQAMPFWILPDPSEGQLAWQIFTSLAHGARGVEYFCYWNPYRPDLFYDVGQLNGAIIRADGTPTRHYEHASRINSVLKAYGPTLMNLTSTQVLHVNETDDPGVVLRGLPLANLTKGFEYLIGLFRHVDGREGVLLNNYDDTLTIWPAVQWSAQVVAVSEVSPLDGVERPLKTDSPQLPGVLLSFDVGYGRLFLCTMRSSSIRTLRDGID